MAHLHSRCLILSLALLASFYAKPAMADSYPSTTIKLIVPFPPGGSADLVGRLLANHLSEKLKQPVVVDNRAGADGMMGPTIASHARPDGYTLLLGAPTLATARATMKALPINPMRDLDAVSQVVESPYVVAINASLPVSDLKSFVEYTKANPGKLHYGAWSTGGKLIYGLLKMRTGIELTHVAYKGEAVTVSALAANEVQASFATAVSVKPKIAQGTVRALVVTSDKRIASLPDVPTSAEANVQDFTPTVWFGLFAPAGTPAAIKAKLAGEVAEFARRQDAIDRLHVVGFETKSSTPEEFTKFLVAAEKQWLDVAVAAGITPQ